MDLEIPQNNSERRKIHRSQDTFYRLVVLLNITAWACLVAALLVLHYARPDFITGVQNYWGIEGRDFWSREHLDDLLTLLQICLVITLVAFTMHTRRNRRKSDSFGYNLIILLVISVLSLATIYSTV